MCPLNIRHCLRVKIQPGFAENRVPAEANQLVRYNQNPDSEVINPIVHQAPLFGRIRYRDKQIPNVPARKWIMVGTPVATYLFTVQAASNPPTVGYHQG